MYIMQNDFEFYEVYDENNHCLDAFETEEKAYAFIILREREHRSN